MSNWVWWVIAAVVAVALGVPVWKAIRGDWSPPLWLQMPGSITESPCVEGGATG